MCKHTKQLEKSDPPKDINCSVCFENIQQEDNAKGISVETFILFPWLFE